LEPGDLSVSYLSSLLRVLQAALRDVASSEDDIRQQFDWRPQPMLVLSSQTAAGCLMFLFTFADAMDSKPLQDISSRTFNVFLDRFGEFIRGLPQPGLWGGAARGSPKRPFDSQVARRMDQVYRELRRSPKATLRFQSRAIEIEGDRLEIT
jgi:hypothetical protein